MLRRLSDGGIPPRIWLTAALFFAFVASFAAYVYAEKQIDRANERRYLSHALADQLRQSSDDLTRMVRTYVVTGNPIYKQSFQDILDIRNGHRRRPNNYENIYWDLALLDPHFAPPEAGGGEPLLDLMRQAGFTDEEFGKLAKAKANSDALTDREFQAMKLAETGGPDAQVNRMRATLMVHDDIYHKAKAAIMEPINEFYDMEEARTLGAVHHPEAMALAFRYTFIAFTLAVVAFLWQTYTESRAILGGSVAEVHARIIKIGRGDFSADAPVDPERYNSVLGGLARTAVRLSDLQAERAQAMAELHEKNESLQRSNADLEQFAYVASHDLQTPLRNIVRYAQLLERRYKKQIDPDADDFIGFIVDSGKHMTQLINDLLEFSRVSCQAEPPHPTSTGEAVALALKNLQQDLDLVGAEVRVENLPMVIAEQTHLVSLFQNLLGNGLKYRAPDRKLVLSVSADRMSEDYWCFAVSDNGIGIGPEYHDKIFEIFQRLNSASNAEGTGIGLTLCRRIVRRFGGTIWVTSVLGEGSTFFFTLRDGSAQSWSPLPQPLHRAQSCAR